MKKKNKFAAKFAIVALAVGLFSPSVSVKSVTSLAVEGYDVSISIFNTAEARQKNRNKNVNRNKNRNKNVNRNSNVNVNRNVNVNHRGGRYYGGGSYNNNNGAALVAGMVVGAAVATAANSN